MRGEPLPMFFPMSFPRVLVIGIGNEFRGDDAAGLAVARAVAGRVPPGVEVIEASGEATELLDLWGRAPEVIVVDAMRAGRSPGERVRVDVRAEGAGGPELPDGWLSSHGLGLATAIRLGRALGRLPARLRLHGIELADEGWGTPLSPAVERSVRALVDELLAEL
jgi:hydrogenase maturation protease